MDHVSTCRFFSFPVKKDNLNYCSRDVNHSLSGAGSFFIPLGHNLKEKSKSSFIRGYGIWGAIDRFEPPEWLKKHKNTKIGFLIGHGEVLAVKDNKVSLSNKLDRWGVQIPYIDCKWHKNELAMVKHMNKTIEEIIEISGGKTMPLNELIRMPIVEGPSWLFRFWWISCSPVLR